MEKYCEELRYVENVKELLSTKANKSDGLYRDKNM